MTDSFAIIKLITGIASGVVLGGGVLIFLAKTLLTDWLRSTTDHFYAKNLELYKTTLQSTAEREFESFKEELQELHRLGQERWSLMRTTCLEALEVVDAHMTHAPWRVNGVPVRVRKLSVDIAKARAVMNKLVLTCKGEEVVKQYVRALGLHSPDEPLDETRSADVIHDLRLAIRAELGFGPHFAFDRRLAWIASLGDTADEALTEELRV